MASINLHSFLVTLVCAIFFQVYQSVLGQPRGRVLRNNQKQNRHHSKVYLLVLNLLNCFILCVLLCHKHTIPLIKSYERNYWKSKYTYKVTSKGYHALFCFFLLNLIAVIYLCLVAISCILIESFGKG